MSTPYFALINLTNPCVHSQLSPVVAGTLRWASTPQSTPLEELHRPRCGSPPKPLLSENKLRADLKQLEEIVPGLRISKRPGLVTVRYKNEEREIGSKLTYVDWAGSPADLLNRSQA